jgi:hypothetical protein
VETIEGFIFVICSRVPSLKSSIKKLVVRGGIGDRTGHPISVIKNCPPKLQCLRGEGMFKQGQDVFFKVLIVEV